MIDALRPYSDYRESGLPWLGRVPAHWELRRLKFLLREVDSRSRSGSEQLLRVSQYTGVTQRRRHAESGLADTRAESLVGYKKVSPQDLVVNIMLAWNGSMGVSRFEGIASPAYCVYRFGSSAYPWYFNELLRTPMYKARIKTASNGVVESRLRLYSDDLGRIEGLLPPLDEQAAIVRFLDYANGRLERAIRAKRKVIALLQEQKQVIIQKAITRGLTPNVPMKDAGVPWLGSFPAHWELRRMSSLATFMSGKAHEHFVDAEGEHICVTVRFVSTGGVSGRRCTRNFSPAQKGDVLMVMSDLPNGRALARAFLVEDDASYAVNQRVCILRPQGAVNPQFLALASNRNRGLLRHDDGSNQTHLSNGDFKTLLIQCPPRAEQDAIVSSIRRPLADIEQRLGLVAREVDLLQEFRTHLVADVVTGKLDVREAARNLPEEPPDVAEVAAGEAADQLDEEVVAE